MCIRDRKQSRENNIENGKESLENNLREKEYDLKLILSNEFLDHLLDKYNSSSMDNIYASIGNGSTNVETIARILEKKYDEKYGKKEDQSNLINKTDSSTSSNLSEGIIIDDLTNLDIKFAKCCSPVPGDPVIGYITTGRGITVHRKNCVNVRNLTNKDRFIKVQWNINTESEFPIVINIISLDRPGYLADLTKELSKNGYNITSIRSKINADGTILIQLSIKVKSNNESETIFRSVKKIDGTLNVFRE